MQLHIPKPCSEDWNAMTPEGDGRFCRSCSKVVVDFTSMTDTEVQNYFLERPGRGLCGRFKKNQLHTITIQINEAAIYQPMPWWKQFLAASLVAFSMLLFSCETKVVNDAAGSHAVEETGGIKAVAKACSITEPPAAKSDVQKIEWVESHVVGELAPPPPVIGEPPPEITMGLPVIELYDTPVIKPDTPAKKLPPLPPCSNDSTIIF